MGSPTHPLPTQSYAAWASTYPWKEIYGYEFVYGGPLFIHQYSHIWIDFRGIQDAYARGNGFAYAARGAPYGTDDGTIVPWTVVASLPLAPEIVLPAVRHFQDAYPHASGEYCFRCGFNLPCPNEADAAAGWTSPYHFGINLGPVVLMCENYRSELLWRPMRACLYVVTGLQRAGFSNGWL